MSRRDETPSNSKCPTTSHKNVLTVESKSRVSFTEQGGSFSRGTSWLGQVSSEIPKGKIFDLHHPVLIGLFDKDKPVGTSFPRSFRRTLHYPIRSVSTKTHGPHGQGPRGWTTGPRGSVCPERSGRRYSTHRSSRLSMRECTSGRRWICCVC